jgi:hypothetical protein
MIDEISKCHHKKKNMCNGCQQIVHPERPWNMDPEDKKATEGLRLGGRTSNVLCFGTGNIVPKSYEEQRE